jgi:Domain of unknown function (DUF222)/HNH endonuclease
MFGTRPVEQIGEWVAELGAEELAGRPNAELSARLLELAALSERIEAELVRTAAQWDAAAAWADDGALSAASWLAFRSTMPRADAVRLVRAGRLVQSHDTTADALSAGSVSAAQVDTLATVVRGREQLYPEHEDALLRAAEALTADDFTMVARQWRSLADDQLAREDAYEVFERRHLHVSSTLFGTVRIDGELDPEGGASFLAALDALDMPDPVDGPVPPRSLSQRRADNLVQLATMSRSEEAGSGRSPVRASLVADVGSLAGRPPTDWSAVRLELERVGPIARDTALRLACDASISRVLMAGRSEVLDLGRSTRLVTPALRRALELRDRGCRGPGCDRPPEWCDAHHLLHWAEGGATNLDNLVLLCRRHHVLLHEGGWHLARGPDGGIAFTRPAAHAGPELVLAS